VNKKESDIEKWTGKRREECRALCLAAIQGNWETAKSFLSKDRGMLGATLTKGGDTVIHIAVTAKCITFVKELLDFMTLEEAAILNRNQDTALCIAAVAGMMEIADLLVVKNNEMPMIRGTGGLIPLGMAAEHGHQEMAQYLYSKTDFSRLNRSEWIRLFFISLSNDLYGTTTLYLQFIAILL
jgi:ankyrin repeat protein